MVLLRAVLVLVDGYSTTIEARIGSERLVFFPLLGCADATMIVCFFREKKRAGPDVNSDGQLDAGLSRDFLAEPALEFAHGVVIPLRRRPLKPELERVYDKS
jgi:hypothetical protein